MRGRQGLLKDVRDASWGLWGYLVVWLRETVYYLTRNSPPPTVPLTRSETPSRALLMALKLKDVCEIGYMTLIYIRGRLRDSFSVGLGGKGWWLGDLIFRITTRKVYTDIH